MNKRLFTVILIVFTNLVGAGVVVPTLPLYAESKFGATALQASIFIAVYHIAQVVGAPIIGQLSDRFGRRPILIWSQVGTILSFLLFLFAGEVGDFLSQYQVGFLSSSLFILYVARMFDGLTGGNISAAQAYITDITPEKDQAQALGYIQSAFGLGLVFGPAFGGVLVRYGLRAPYVGAIVITMICLLMTVFFLPESLSAEKRNIQTEKPRQLYQTYPAFLRQSTILLILALSCAVTFTIAALSGTFALFASEVAYPNVVDQENIVRNVSYMMTYLGIAAVLSQVLMLKRLIATIGEQNTIILSIMSASLTCLALSYLSNPWFIMLALTPAAFAYATGIPAGQALLVRMGTAQEKGQLIGLYQMVNSLAYFIGPIWGGFLFDTYSPRAPWMASGFLVILSLGLAFMLKARTIPSAYSMRQ